MTGENRGCAGCLCVCLRLANLKISASPVEAARMQPPCAGPWMLTLSLYMQHTGPQWSGISLTCFHPMAAVHWAALVGLPIPVVRSVVLPRCTRVPLPEIHRGLWTVSVRMPCSNGFPGRGLHVGTRGSHAGTGGIPMGSQLAVRVPLWG